MIVCPHCHQLNETGDTACRGCGKSLAPPENDTVAPVAVTPVPITDSRVGDYFNKGWELFKLYPLGFIGYFLVCLVITLLLERVPIIGPLVSFILAAPLNAGFFVVSAMLLKHHQPEFSDFFLGLRFFQQLAFFGVISTILIVIGLLLLVAPGIYLLVGYTFALMLIVDRGLDFWTAMETSRRSVQTRWFKIFGLLLFLLLINLGGCLLLGVGLLVTAPLTHCILTVAYDDIFGLKSDYTQTMRNK
jgi:uncharacterized membrane protein